MYRSDELPRLIIRMPADLKLFIERKSRKDAVSQNALVIQALRQWQEAAGRAA